MTRIIKPEDRLVCNKGMEVLLEWESQLLIEMAKKRQLAKFKAEAEVKAKAQLNGNPNQS